MGIQVGFDLTTDAGGLLGGISDATHAMNQLKATTSSYEGESKSTFSKAGAEVQGLSRELVNGQKAVGQFVKESAGFNKVIDSSKSLRAAIRQTIQEAANLRSKGDLIGADQAIKHAGELKEKLIDIQKAVKAVSGTAASNIATGFGSATRFAVQGFEGVLAVQSLVGVKSEEFEKQLLRIQALSSLSRIASEFGEVGKRIDEIKLAFTPLKDLYTNANSALLNFGKTGVVAMEASSVASTGFFTGIKAGAVSAVQSLRTLWLAMLANPAGVLIAALAALAAILIYSKAEAAAYAETLREVVKKSMKELEDQTKANKDQLNGLIVSQEADLEVLKARKAPMDEIIKKMKEIHDLKKQEIALDLIESDTKAFTIQRELQGLKEKKGSFLDLLLIMGLGISDAEERREKVKDLTTQLEAQRAASEKIRGSIEALDKKAVADRINLQNEALAKQKAINDKVAALHKELTDKIKELYEKADKAVLEGLSGEAKIKKQEEISLKEIAVLKKELIEKGQAEVDYYNKSHAKKMAAFQLSADQQAQFTLLEKAVYNKTTTDLLTLQAARHKIIADQAKSQAASNLAEIEADQASQIAAVELIQKGKKQTDEDFELIKQKRALEIQRDSAIKILEAKQKAAQTEHLATQNDIQSELDLLAGKNDKESLLRKEALKQELADNEVKFAATGQQLQTETAATINKLQKQIEDAEKELNKRGKTIDILKMLGISPEQAQAFNQAIGEVQNAVDSVYAIQQQALDNQIENSKEQEKLAQDQIDSRENAIKDLESKLGKENDLKTKGIANNSSLIQRQIDEQKKALAVEQAAKDAALAKEKAAAEKKKELAKEQLAIDTVIQGSQLLTASANVLASFSAIPVVGPVLGIAAVAAMIGGFIAQKAAILAEINQPVKLAEGEIGINGPGTSTSDSIPAMLSKGESVISARKTREHHTILKGIHLGDNAMIGAGILDELKSRPSLITPALTRELLDNKEVIRQISANINMDTSRMERQLSDLNDKYETSMKESRHRTYVDQEGNLVQVMGSHTVVTRRKKG